MATFKMTPQVALGVRDKRQAAADFCRLLGTRITDERDNWIEVNTGPIIFYFVEDEVRDPGFLFEVSDAEAAIAELREMGWTYDELVSEQTKEPFMRSPDGYLFNIWERKNS